MPRDASGNYTLPAGNPVVTGTVITSAWANPTMSDIGNEITNSLSRNGQGGMLAPLFFADGNINDPSIAFTQETTLGLYRSATSVMSIAGLGKNIASFDASTGQLSLRSSASPSVRLYPDADSGNAIFGMHDDLGNHRFLMINSTLDGRVDFRRYNAAGAILTQLRFDDNGNVDVTQGDGNDSAPVKASDLTRKDYVDAADAATLVSANAYTDAAIAANEAFPAGTVMLFYQASAPTGWTQKTDIGDSMIQIVGGGGGGIAGGATPFATWNAQTSAGSTTLTAAQSGLPAHAHTGWFQATNNIGGQPTGFTGGDQRWPQASTSNNAAANAAQGHTHSLTHNVKYANFIVATKN